MKKQFYLLITAFIALSLFFTACNKEPDYFADAIPSISAGALANIVLQPANTCGGIVTSNLIAGKDFDTPIGYVSVTQGEGDDFLTITYLIDKPGWFITETHFGVYDEWENFPGYPLNPKIGNFNFNKDDHNYVTNFSFQIDLEDFVEPDDHTLSIMAHATVINKGTCACPDDTKLPEEVDLLIHYPNAESYFGISISEGGILNGDYDGWCSDDDKLIYRETPYHAIVYSSINSEADLSSVVDRPENLYKVNYLLNKDLSAFTLGEIQMALWTLLEPVGGVHDPGGLGPWIQTNVDAILALTDGLTEFNPDCNNPYFAVLLQPIDPATGLPTVQPALIKYCTPGSETAWSAGNDFSISRSWAMWFPFTFCYPF